MIPIAKLQKRPGFEGESLADRAADGGGQFTLQAAMAIADVLVEFRAQFDRAELQPAEHADLNAHIDIAKTTKPVVVIL